MNDGDIALDYGPNRRPAIPACGARTYDTTRRIEHVMSEADRNALIDAYFDAMDAEEATNADDPTDADDESAPVASDGGREDEDR